MVDLVSLLTLIVALGDGFSKLSRLRRRKKSSPDHSWICKCLEHLQSACSLGFSSHSLGPLVKNLLLAVQHADKGAPAKDIEHYRERFMSKYFQLVESTLQQMLPKDMKAQTAEKLNKEQMITAITDIVQKEAVNNPMLRKLPFVQDMARPTEMVEMLYDKVLVFQCNDYLLLMLQAPRAEKKGACEVMVPEKAGLVIEMENKREQNASEREVQVVSNAELVNEVVLYNRDRDLGLIAQKGADVTCVDKGEGKAGLVIEMENKREQNASEREVQVVSSAELVNEVVLYNPNRDLGLFAQKGAGVICLDKGKGNQWRVKFQGSSTELRMVTGKMQMQVSPKLGFLYYEVTLVDMVEQGYSSDPGLYPHLTPRDLEPGLAGVGVGLARHFEAKKVAGKYSKSYGFDGRVGQAFLQNHRDWDFDSIGRFEMGDTFGIGLCTQIEGKPFLFLTKNGVFRGRMSHHTLSHSHLAKDLKSLYPIISLASADVEILVNFHGPFHFSSFSDLVALAVNASS